MEDVIPIGRPSRRYVQTYGRRGPIGITLWATGEETILSLWSDELHDLRVDGVLIATGPQ